VIGIRGNYEGPRLYSEEVVLAHHPRHTFVVRKHSAAPQFGCDSSIAVAPPMFHGDLLNGRANFHIFLDRHLLLQRSIETRPADTGQTAHLLDTQAALHRHHFPDLVVDAVSPVLSLLWRRASTFCKAPSKINRWAEEGAG
jgi:hypothetical protein